MGAVACRGSSALAARIGEVFGYVNLRVRPGVFGRTPDQVARKVRRSSGTANIEAPRRAPKAERDSPSGATGAHNAAEIGRSHRLPGL